MARWVIIWSPEILCLVAIFYSATWNSKLIMGLFIQTRNRFPQHTIWYALQKCRYKRKNAIYLWGFSFAIWCQILKDITMSICSTRREYLGIVPHFFFLFFTFYSDATAACGHIQVFKEVEAFTLIWRSWCRWSLATSTPEPGEVLCFDCMKKLFPSIPASSLYPDQDKSECIHHQIKTSID